MKTMKKILCTVLVVVLCLTSAPLGGFVGLELPEWNWKASAVDEKPTSGQCGDNAYWNFDKNTGILTISGNGETWNYHTDDNVVAEFMDFYRDEILTLIVEEGITTIGDYFFVDGHLIASGVENIIFPETLTKIGNCAFLYNANLKNIRFEGSLTEIGHMAFSCCYSLESISGLKNIDKIGDLAFSFCICLETITGLESVKEIGESAFGVCYKLKSINLASTEKIGNSAFNVCISLEDIDLNSAKEIGEQAFNTCFSLESIDLPQSLNNLGKEAFLNCIFLDETFVYNPDIIFNENSLCVTQVASLDEVSMEELVSLSIDYCDTLFSLLGSEDKSELEAIEMELEKHIIEYETPQPHGNIVCYEGSTAETYAIENGVNYRYFSNEEPERTVVATGKCGDNAYYTLYSDGELVISGEGEMWDSASPFFGLDIKKVIIENGITTIGEEAFDNCYSIESVEISNSVNTIGNEAFYKCIELKEISLGSGVETIGKMAFYGCWFLEEITIPKNVKNIGDEVFTTCYQLKNISVDSNSITYSNDEFGVLYNKDKTVLVQYPSGNLRNEYAIPESVEVIAPNAFSNSKKLEKITIGENVSQIEMNAFNGCIGLVNIEISDNVEHIADLAFGGCENLVTVTMGKSIEQIDGGAFTFCFNLTDIYYNGTEQEWNKIAINEDNQEIFNATIHFLDEEDCTHKETFEQTIPASCTVNGMKFTVCVDCGETIGSPEVIPAAHTPGEWETVLEPTYEAEGKKVKKCTACGEILEEETLPKLELVVVEDEETGVGLEFPAENYDGKVEIEVEESFDGTAFNILDTKTGAVQQKIYDIKMLVDGEVTQPNGKVKVKLPLPAGYNPKFSFVYYVNTETGAVEKMEATYEDGYMVFETDHFSYYAVIAEPDTDNCSCSCHKNGIAKFFFNFILFFQRIFKANKTCKCGINHY